VQAIDRAFAVLGVLRDSGESLGVSAIARETGLAKSTVFRLLSALEDVGAVERLDDGGRYGIGAGLVALAGKASGALSFRDIARPILRELTDSLGESAGLTVPDGNSALYLDHVPSGNSVHTRDWTGMRFPFHTVAGGHAMLMTWPDPAIDRLADQGLDPFTDRTVTSKSALRQRIVQARRVGYAWTYGDFDDEINGVAAPVRGVGDRAIGALTVYGPSYRFPGDADPDAIGHTVRAAAEAVQERMS
jgi:DNA-binding IclR family transcriptional regulator